MLCFRADASISNSTQPDGGDLEDCTMVHIANLYSSTQWHDIPCAYKAEEFICKQQVTKGKGPV